MRIGSIFWLSIFLLGAQQKYWLPVRPPYNLQSDQRYTLYLPARVKELQKKIIQDGLPQTISMIRDDRDLESYLFVLSIEKPIKMLAYSRQPQFFDQTTDALQTLIFPSYSSTDLSHQVHVIFDQLVSTAYKGDTYLSYLWRFNDKDPITPQVAYVHLMDFNEKPYVIGCAVFVKMVPDYIILPHRTKTILHKIKTEGLEKALDAINNDLDPELYFFVMNIDYPSRWIAHGRNAKLIGKTPEEAQKTLFKTCLTPECDLRTTVSNIIKIAMRGGGYHAYVWQARPEDPIQLKLSYIQPFTYNKRKLFLGTGYTPLYIPDRLRTELPKAVDNTLSLIADVGLDNTVSVIQKTNTPQLYVFIIEQEYPYHIIVHPTKGIQGKIADEATAYARQHKNFGINYRKIYDGMARFVQEGGGFYAYEYKAPTPNAAAMLKIAYIKMATVSNKNYIVGATYESLS